MDAMCPVWFSGQVQHLPSYGELFFTSLGNALSARTLSTNWTLTSFCRSIHLPCVQGLHVSSGLDWHIWCPCLQPGLWCHLLDGPWTWVLGSISLTLSLASFSAWTLDLVHHIWGCWWAMTPASGFAHTLQVHGDYAELVRTRASPAHCQYSLWLCKFWVGLTSL